MRCTIIMTLLAALGLLALLGCGGGQPTTALAEGEVIARAPDLVAPAEQYRARVTGIDQGRVEQVVITGYGVKPDTTLVVDPLDVTLTGVRFDRNPFRITGLEHATCYGRITEVALNNALRAQGRVANGNIKNVRVTLAKGLVTVTSTYTVGLVDVPVTTTGWLRATDGLRITYVPDAMKVVGIGVPAQVQALIAAQVNPLVDLSGLRFTPKIEGIDVQAGAVFFSGTALIRY